MTGITAGVSTDIEKMYQESLTESVVCCPAQSGITDFFDLLGVLWVM